MIDLSTETLVPWQQAAKHVPGQPHISTLHRWRLKGVKGHRLETLSVGGRRFTSREAIDRFIVAGNSSDAPAAAPSFTATQRQKMSDAARATLASEFGI
jgi:hypothetical protein